MARVFLGACVLALGIFLFPAAEDSFQVAKRFFGIATFDATTAWDLQEMCGYGRDGTPGVRPYPEDCVAKIRKLIRKSSTRGNVAALQSANAYRRNCIAELLELPDAELVDMVAGWSAREAREVGNVMLAEAVVSLKTVDRFRC